MLRFEWDARKAAQNRRKHRISFAHACTVFGDPLSLTIPDPDASHGEERLMTMGASKTGDLLVVVHTERENIIRIISARRATKQERLDYEKGIR